MTRTTTMEGSATAQGALWGARPRDWAEAEAKQTPTYVEAVERLGIGPGDAVLDVGCGAGTFLGLAAERGARVHGLDAAETLVALARERVPGADLRVGDLQWLPYDDDSFDVVTGFNSFFFAADMGAALAEAARVARPSASVLIQAWGRPEQCDLAPMIAAMGSLRGAPAAAVPPAAPLWKPGVIEGMAEQAGLRPRAAFDHRCAFHYADEDALVRGVRGAGGVVQAAQAAGEEAVRAAIVDSLASHRDPDGSYTLENEWRQVVATA